MSPRTLYISEEKPLRLKSIFGTATLYPDRIEHRGETRQLADVTHIEWHWLSQTINFLNQQHTHLVLHCKGHPSPLKINRTSMYATPKLVIAYEYIAQQTFEQRVAGYVSQLERDGHFEYQGHRFCSDGTVAKGQASLPLSSAKFEPFKMTLSEGGLFGTKFRIDLRVDRDVVTALFNHIQEHPIPPADLRAATEHRKQAQRVLDDLTTDLVFLFVKLGEADGTLCERERRKIGRLLRDGLGLPTPPPASLDALVQQASTSPEPFEFYARRIIRRQTTPSALKPAILDALFEVATADNNLSAEEELLLEEAEAVFGLPGPRYSAHKARRAAQSRRRTNGAEVHYRVLGLDASASIEHIKQRYRRLVMQYHPDRSQHLGDSFVGEAEIRIKSINEAYEQICAMRGI